MLATVSLCQQAFGFSRFSQFDLAGAYQVLKNTGDLVIERWH